MPSTRYSPLNPTWNQSAHSITQPDSLSLGIRSNQDHSQRIDQAKKPPLPVTKPTSVENRLLIQRIIHSPDLSQVKVDETRRRMNIDSDLHRTSMISNIYNPLLTAQLLPRQCHMISHHNSRNLPIMLWLDLSLNYCRLRLPRKSPRSAKLLALRATSLFLMRGRTLLPIFGRTILYP